MVLPTSKPPERRLIRRRKLPPVKAGRLIVATSANTTHWIPPEPGNRIYALIGQIAMEWTLIENVLDDCIALIVDVNIQIAACITAQMMGHAAPRCLTIKALAHWRGLPEIAKAAERLQNGLFEAADRRNRAIHDRTLIETKERTAFKDHRMSKNELLFGLKEFDVGEFEKAIALIQRRRDDVVKLLI